MKTYSFPITLIISTLLVQRWATHFSYIDASGFLHEPGFFTVPLGLLVIGAALMRIVWCFYQRHWGHKRLNR